MKKAIKNVIEGITALIAILGGLLFLIVALMLLTIVIIAFSPLWIPLVVILFIVKQSE